MVQGGIKTETARLEMGQRLLLRDESRRDVRAVAGADVRLVVVEVELAKLHDLLEERGVLRIEQRGGVVVVEAVVVAHVRRRMGRRHVRVRL